MDEIADNPDPAASQSPARSDAGPSDIELVARVCAGDEAAFEQLSSGSHRAAAWTAQADLSVRRGDKDTALSLYRRAAETLQDFRF